MNIVLMVMDSLRRQSIIPSNPQRSITPFFDNFKNAALSFNAAYAPECWTLPTHMSMFTGRMPSEHGAHFAHMAYTQPAPTLAETLSEHGYHTEVITRNSIFDGGVPGITRGFAKNTAIHSERTRFNPGAWMLAMNKARFRRQLMSTGFVSAAQRENLRFVQGFIKAMFPADDQACRYTLEQMASLKKTGKPYFLFCNLYDVHAPYPPVDDSIFLPMNTVSNIVDNINAFQGLAKISLHAYLQAGFSLPEAQRLALLARYRCAVERMDRTVGQFYAAAEAVGLWDDTLFILTADHGEAFGEHAVYLHDASLYDENISVPLWIKHPHRAPQEIDEVVTTRDLFQVMRSAAGLESEANTLLDREYRHRHPIAFAEHFYYPHVENIAPHYAQNIRAAVSHDYKVIVRREGAEMYERSSDPWEKKPFAPNRDEIGDAMQGATDFLTGAGQGLAGSAA
jgi:arylsulfatase A-like enzyme